MLRSVSWMMDREHFPAGGLEQGMLARDEIETWQRELMAAGEERRFTIAGMMFAVEGRK